MRLPVHFANRLGYSLRSAIGAAIAVIFSIWVARDAFFEASILITIVTIATISPTTGATLGSIKSVLMGTAQAVLFAFPAQMIIDQALEIRMLDNGYI